MNAIQSAEHKALKINLDNDIYGTFAEIGAGQEVAGNFFKVGAASGTIAKSISAYDMTFSDSIYGREEGGRYVCQSRVKKMINYEFDLLIERLCDKFPERKFFAFANTVVARNYQGTNSPHGWFGLRFQSKPGEKPSDLIMHIKMHDSTNILQQKAIGILGINTIHAAFYKRANYQELVADLMDNLSRQRVEINMIEVRGPAFDHIDNRLLNLELITRSYTDAIMFDECGQIRLAQDELYKKDIILTRGSYRPPTKVNVDIQKTGLSNFAKDIGANEADVASLAEITINHLKEDGEITGEDFLARVDLLTSIGQKVLISNMPQFYSLSNYLAGFKPKHIALVLGVYNFMQIFDDKHTELSGGVMAAFGELLKPNAKIYLYPYKENDTDENLVDLNSATVRDEYKHLLDHIKASGQVKNLTGFKEELLHIYSRKVLDMIRNSEDGWEAFVPDEISKTINEKCLFGHPCDTK